MYRALLTELLNITIAKSQNPPLLKISKKQKSKATTLAIMPHKQTRKQGMATLLKTSSSALESPEPMITTATNPEPTAQTGEASSSSTKGKKQEREN